MIVTLLHAAGLQLRAGGARSSPLLSCQPALLPCPAEVLLAGTLAAASSSTTNPLLVPVALLNRSQLWLKPGSNLDSTVLNPAPNLAPPPAADPVAMKEFVVAVHVRAGEAGGAGTLTRRAQMLLELVVDVKNNRWGREGRSQGGRETEGCGV